MSNERKQETAKSTNLKDSQLESVTGGSFSPEKTVSSILHAAEEIVGTGTEAVSSALAGDKVIHKVCGAQLSFRQIAGTYYCPICKKEVPFNEIIKGAGPSDTVARV